MFEPGVQRVDRNAHQTAMDQYVIKRKRKKPRKRKVLVHYEKSVAQAPMDNYLVGAQRNKRRKRKKTDSLYQSQ